MTLCNALLLRLPRDPHHRATADSILNELQQHGWRVVSSVIEYMWSDDAIRAATEALYLRLYAPSSERIVVMTMEDVARNVLDAAVSRQPVVTLGDHDGMLVVWVCNRCGRPIGEDGRCNSGVHVGPGDADHGPSSGHAVATTDLVAERNAVINERDRLLARMELLYDELQAFMDACGHCATGGRPPNEVMIESAREALRASRTGDL